ncbi:MAG: DinB family protein, partial [Acidobacteriota bacterium]
HLGETDYFWISSIAMEREMADEEKRLSHCCDTMENDVDRGFTARYCIDTIDRISADTRQWLSVLNDGVLSRFHPRSGVSPPQKVSLAHILQCLVDHEGHHRGQIAMIKRKLRERNA